MGERIVDSFETVDIADRDAERLVVALSEFKLLDRLFVEVSPVVEFRQFVTNTQFFKSSSLSLDSVVGGL